MTSTQAIIERTLAGMGYELVDVEYAQDGLLRVYIDAPSGIGLDDCEKVSRQLSHVLAVEDVDYARLEVSSPGVDRPLKKAADFERFAGAEVSVRLRRPLEGRRTFEGVLTLEGDGRYGLELVERPSKAAGSKGRRRDRKPARRARRAGRRRQARRRRRRRRRRPRAPGPRGASSCSCSTRSSGLGWCRS